MQSATPVAVHVMGATEGAAWRVQLDGMLAVLEGFDTDAKDANDTGVRWLLWHIRAARQVAATIEQRDAPAPNAYQGVSLAKN